MPSYTSPDAIAAPVVGDPIAPLQTWFQTLASSTQTALTNLRNQVTSAELPDPISGDGAAQQSVTATAWADLPNGPSLTLTLPQACWVQITIGAWVIATQSDIRASSRVSGATTLGETQLEVGGPTTSWGQVLFADATSATRQASGARIVRLNAGVNNFKMRAYKSGGSGLNMVNYSTLQVSPIRWA